MTIYDDILNKAKSQEDLQDVAQYLKKPLQLLHELQQKLEALPEREKNSLENTQVQIKVNNILNKYLPGMLDEYCKFALSYRNTHIIKNNNDGRTAKELLLDNIARITEESNLLHEEFHENNKFQFLVHEKIASSLGMQPQTAGALKLQNQFNYATHATTKTEIFKKEEPAIISKPVKEAAAKAKKHAGGGFNLVEIILVVGFIAMVAIGAYTMYSGVEGGMKSQRTITQIMKVDNAMSNLKYADVFLNGYGSLNNEFLVEKTGLSLQYDLTTPLGETIKVAPATLTAKNDTYMIELNNIPENICNIMSKKLKEFSYQYTKVNINENNVCDDINTIQLIK